MVGSSHVRLLLEVVGEAFILGLVGISWGSLLCALSPLQPAAGIAVTSGLLGFISRISKEKADKTAFQDQLRVSHKLQASQGFRCCSWGRQPGLHT